MLRIRLFGIEASFDAEKLEWSSEDRIVEVMLNGTVDKLEFGFSNSIIPGYDRMALEMAQKAFKESPLEVVELSEPPDLVEEPGVDV